ncbi:MAG: PAS domain-containing sensor histidine kinase, partial [Bacteroidales bacterium]|nr:PAS domain-containing sensor histidine kinase [Bacteroidales bacterium]
MYSQAKEKIEFEHLRKIFLLNSYYQTHTWVIAETKGYSPYLYRPDYELDIEYLSAINTAKTPERNRILLNCFDAFYGRKDYDLIIIISQPAYEFVAQNYPLLTFMHGKKIVCAGVAIDDSLPEIPNVLFLSLKFAVNETVEQILKFEPAITDIFIINDNTSSGLASKKAIQQQIEKTSCLKGKNINIRYNKNSNSDDLMQEIKQLPPTTVLLVGFYAQTGKGYDISPEEFVSTLTGASTFPIFCLVDIYMQEEMIGGKMLEGITLGKLIGQLAQSILNKGTAPCSIIHQEQSRWKFSYPQIANHKWFDALPKKAELKYKPLGFFEKHKLWIIPVAFLLGLSFVAFLIVLYFNRLLRAKLTEKTQSLRQYVSKFEQFVENMPIAYIELDTAYTIRYWNSATQKMFGYAQSEVCNVHVDDIVNLQSSNAHISSIIKNIISQDISNSIINVAKKDGSMMVCEWFFTAVRDENGIPMHYMCMVVDITEETRLRKELEVMVEKSKAMLLQNDRFIAYSMHDLKNLMTPIISYSELLNLEQTTPKMKSTIAKLNKAANSVVQVFIEMMDISRIRSGLVHVEKQPFDLLPLVCDIMSMLEINFKRKNITVTNTIGQNIKVLIDLEMTHSIFLNLLGNAIKFTYPNGNIVMSAEQENEDFVAVSISNDGMPADI